MAYVIFHTDRDCSEAEYRREKRLMIKKVYGELLDALGWANLLHQRGAVAWEIESESGEVLFDRRQIREAIQKRKFELSERPKVY